MSRIRDFFKKRKKLGNKGEAMILMIVAIGIIMFLGMSLLYAASTAYMIRNTERKSEDTFNSADTGMDLLKNRLTEVESKAAEKGYATTLNLYADSQSDQVNFKNSFLEGLLDVDVYNDGTTKVNTTADTTAKRLFKGTSGKISSYDTDAIAYLFKGMTTGSKGDTYELNCSGNAVMSSDFDSVTLKDISLKYTRHDGYVTKVTTDIKLKVPQITASSPSEGFEHLILSGFSCVVDRNLILYKTGETGSSAPSGAIQGSIYAGSVSVRDNPLEVTAGHKVIIGRTRETSEDEAGNVIVNTDDSKRTDGQLNVTVAGDSVDTSSSGIDVKEDGELWTQDINLIKNVSVNSEAGSSIMVADDLNFEDGGSATINGNYIGFGNGDTSEKSSSIVFNDPKRKAKLDLSGAQSLMLAGYSFILPGKAVGNEIGMGSSITAKGEQTAYLIPAGDGGILESGMTNPQKVDKNHAEEQKQKVINLLNEKMSSRVNGMAKPLSEYQPQVKVLSYPVSGENSYIQYYFFSFNSTAMANAYFKDYFNSNVNDIQSYISQYADIKGLKESVSKTAGTGLTTDKGDISITDAVRDNTEMNNAARKYQKQYKNLSETLDKDKSGDSTPFYSMIDVKKLHETCGNTRSNRLIPIAWWINNHDISAVYSEDQQDDKDIGNFSNNLVVEDKLFNRRGDYVFPTYQYDSSTNTAALYELNLKKNGTDLKTSPDSSDTGCYAVIQGSEDVILKEYNGNGSLTTEELQNIIGITQSGNLQTYKKDPDSYGKAAGYIAWTNPSETVEINGDTQINFLIVDGNASIAKSNFNGLIMCSGNLESDGGTISLNNDAGAKALAKSHIWRGNTGGVKKSSSEDWTLGKMVVYENWKKN